MSTGTLYDKVWDLHRVAELPGGQTQLFIGLHLIHEVTSPQAFAMLGERGLRVRHPERTVATVDHIVPTTDQGRPLADPLAEAMLSALEKNCADHGLRLHGFDSGQQGIVHVIAPELGLSQPGMTIACGDSHTSTHGAFGAIAFGIGTSQVRDVLASQSLALDKLKVRRIAVHGSLAPGVFAKDVALHVIRRLGVKSGMGHAYEFAGSCVAAMTMEERMTLCNMAIEAGARCGYVNPDQVCFDYLRNRPGAPAGAAWQRAVTWWRSLASDGDAVYDDEVAMDAGEIAPTVTWGITPGQAIAVDEVVPAPDQLPPGERPLAQEAYRYMDLQPGQPIAGTPVDVCFIGSCTNGRLSDLRDAAQVAKGRHVADGMKAFVVPGSQQVARAAEAEGLDVVFAQAGFEWRRPGCSMCLAMNPDRLEGRQLSASSSNRNFKGRQGSAAGRTLLMSPAMVAAAAVSGVVTDVRTMLSTAKDTGRGAVPMTAAPVTTVEGRGIALQGHDIDTDRIIPARFLKTISFSGLGDHVFADDRAAAGGRHPFDRPEHQGARILVVNRNFGCGSSREHAPQALRRWGIAAVIGESFAEIFASNCLALGMPCLRGETGAIEEIQQRVQEQPQAHFCLRLAASTLHGPDRRWPLMIENGPQTMLLSGCWDATGLLLSHGKELRQTALQLPYLNDFVLPG